MLSNIFSPIISRSPALKRVVWKRWYQFLASGYKQEDWTFMNYGFADKPEAPVIVLAACRRSLTVAPSNCTTASSAAWTFAIASYSKSVRDEAAVPRISRAT